MAYVDYKLKTTDPIRGTRMSKYPSAIITTVGLGKFSISGIWILGGYPLVN